MFQYTLVAALQSVNARCLRSRCLVCFEMMTSNFEQVANAAVTRRNLRPDPLNCSDAFGVLVPSCAGGETSAR